MTKDQLKAEKSDLQRRLAARIGIPMYAKNITEIKLRLAEIEKELAALDD